MGNKADREYEEITSMLSKINEAKYNTKGVTLLREENEINGNNDTIYITDNPRFGDNVLSSQKDNINSCLPGYSIKYAEEPLKYYPKDHNITFEGTIPEFNNLTFKFLFTAPGGDGCLISVTDLPLSDKSIEIIAKLHGAYKNWKDYWIENDKNLSDFEK